MRSLKIFGLVATLLVALVMCAGSDCGFVIPGGYSVPIPVVYDYYYDPYYYDYGYYDQYYYDYGYYDCGYYCY